MSEKNMDETQQPEVEELLIIPASAQKVAATWGNPIPVTVTINGTKQTLLIRRLLTDDGIAGDIARSLQPYMKSGTNE